MPGPFDRNRPDAAQSRRVKALCAARFEGAVWDRRIAKPVADIVALAETAGITPRGLPQGKLGVQEEFASEVAEIILTGDTATT